MAQLVLTGARLLTGDGPPIFDATVMVEDVRILSVLPAPTAHQRPPTRSQMSLIWRAGP